MEAVRAFFKHPLLYVWLVLIGALVGAGLLRPTGDVQSIGQANAQTQQTQTQGTNASQPQSARVEQDQAGPKPYTADCNKPKDHDAADFCQQVRMADAAEAQNRINSFGLGALIFTLIATGIAAYAALRTVWTMQDTAKRQLRAYIGHMPMGAHFESAWVVEEGGWERAKQTGPVKYFDQNHGQTPAYHVAMYVRIIDKIDTPPVDIDWSLGAKDSQEFLSFVPPKQNIGCIVGTQKREDTFFLYGYTEYTDVFGGRWRHRFGFSHNPKRGEAWVPHASCNGEDKLGTVEPPN